MTVLTRGWLRLAEFLLLSTAGVSGLYCTSVAVQAAAARRVGEKIVSGMGTGQANVEQPVAAHPGSNSKPVSLSPTVMGRLEIRELNLAVPIMSDYEANSLLKGVGHIPGTAMPGGLGTIGLAGHRDTYFRPLRGIKPKMDIRVADKTGVYHYSVDSTEIVKPEAVEVLDIQSRPELTLITCFPFQYIGAAPKRFIVHAHLMSALPDGQ